MRTIRRLLVSLPIVIGVLNLTAHFGTAETVSEIRVVDDNSRGIKSEIITVDPDNKESFMQETDANGVVRLNYECKQSQRLKAKPMDQSYYPSRPKPCDSSVLTLPVSKRAVVMILKTHAESAVKREDYGIAALLYTEIAARVGSSDTKLAVQAEKNTYLFAGKKLGVVDPIIFDQPQNKFVMSPNFLAALVKFQKDNGILAKGQLNFMTLKILADDASIAGFLTTSSPQK